MEKCQILQRKILSLSNLSLKMKPSFHKKLFQKEKNKFLCGNFQVICGSMVSKNHWSPASTETPDILCYMCYVDIIYTHI